MNRAFSPLESPAIPGPDRGAAESADPRSPGAAPVRSAGGANHVSLARSPHRYTQLATGSAPWARPSAWTSGAPPISVPEGRSENSTALQCRGPSVDALTSPVGTTEMSSQLQSSLRDAWGADSGEQQRDTPVFHLVSQGLCMTMWAKPQEFHRRKRRRGLKARLIAPASEPPGRVENRPHAIPDEPLPPSFEERGKEPVPGPGPREGPHQPLPIDESSHVRRRGRHRQRKRRARRQETRDYLLVLLRLRGTGRVQKSSARGHAGGN